MGTPPFAAKILGALLAAGRPPVAVVCQPARATGRGLKEQPSAVEVLAREKGLPVLAADNINTPENIAQLKTYRADLFLVAAFGQILKNEVLAIPAHYSLNVHGSLLPKWRGAAPIQRALLAGETTAGVTIQKMARRMDAGDILLTRTIPVAPKDTSGDLFEKISVLGGEALIEALRQVEDGNAQFTPQNESDASYAPKLTREEAAIDWTQEASRLSFAVRALQPWPVAETKLGKDRLKVFSVEVVPSSVVLEPGETHTDHASFLWVGCGSGTVLALTQIQLENRKKLEIRDFLMAYRGAFPFKRIG
jgi:methionyl-tRNA formyltransferase